MGRPTSDIDPLGEETEMTDAQKVLYRLKNNYYEYVWCDDCLAQVTGIERREVSAIARTIVGLFPNEFSRSKTVCRGCTAKMKWVTSYNHDAQVQCDALSLIKQNAERYLKEAKKAGKALNRLSECLSALEPNRH
jgi:hypothetical protein